MRLATDERRGALHGLTRGEALTFANFTEVPGRVHNVVKAHSLDAHAVLVGRPYVQGWGVAGEAGVARVLGILRTAPDRTLALLGVPELGALDRDVLTRSAGDIPMP